MHQQIVPLDRVRVGISAVEGSEVADLEAQAEETFKPWTTFSKEQNQALKERARQRFWICLLGSLGG